MRNPSRASVAPEDSLSHPVLRIPETGAARERRFFHPQAFVKLLMSELSSMPSLMVILSPRYQGEQGHHRSSVASPRGSPLEQVCSFGQKPDFNGASRDSPV